MRRPATTDKEVLLRELEETEAVLNEISLAIGCTCIIDPTETLADRIRHLGTMTLMLAVNLQQIVDRSAPKSYSDVLRRMGDN